MRHASHARAIGVPVEQIKGRWLLAQQIVVDDIAPDQVVGAQHIEHRCHRAVLQVATLQHLSFYIGDLRLINEDRGLANLRKILQGDKERGSVDRLIPLRHEIGQHHREQRAADAVANGVDPGRASDLFDDVECRERSERQVVLEADLFH